MSNHEDSATNVPEVKKPEAATALQALKENVQALKITDVQGFEQSGVLLVQVTQKLKEMKAEKDERLRPLKQEVKTITGEYDVPLKTLDHMKSWLNAGRATYTAEVEAERRRLQAIEAKRHEKKVEKAIEKAEKKGIAPIIPPAKIIQNTIQTVQTTHGNVGMKKKPKQFRIPNVEKYEYGEVFRNDQRVQHIPDEFFVLDDKKIGKIIRAGGSIPGVDAYDDYTSSVTGA